MSEPAIRAIARPRRLPPIRLPGRSRARPRSRRAARLPPSTPPVARPGRSPRAARSRPTARRRSGQSPPTPSRSARVGAASRRLPDRRVPAAASRRPWAFEAPALVRASCGERAWSSRLGGSRPSLAGGPRSCGLTSVVIVAGYGAPWRPPRVGCANAEVQGTGRRGRAGEGGPSASGGQRPSISPSKCSGSTGLRRWRSNPAASARA